MLKSGRTLSVQLSTNFVEPHRTYIYVISNSGRIMDRRLYKTWNYQVWRTAVKELHHNSDEQLNVTLDGILALDREPLGRVY
jgi:hypothetical protein